MLKKYWFRFSAIPKPTPLNLGCGVTAFDYDDAIFLMQSLIFRGDTMPLIVDYAVDVRQSDLEKSHVLPNIGNLSVRGIWFPQGYI